MTSGFPHLRQTVLDTTDARGLAEFWRQLLGLRYRPGDEVPAAGPDVNGQDWLVLDDDSGRTVLAFQQVGSLPAATWPDGPVPQQAHVDLSVADQEELDAQHERAIAFGATLLLDDTDNPEEPKRVYADPSGHPFCIFVG